MCKSSKICPHLHEERHIGNPDNGDSLYHSTFVCNVFCPSGHTNNVNGSSSSSNS
jgi:hypothetical protein